jgi:hypothetical protein
VNNLLGEKIIPCLFATVLVLGVSLTNNYSVQAAEVEERNLMTAPANAEAPAVESVAKSPPATDSDSPAAEAKEEFSDGFKGVGNGFKKGVHATGRGFKRAGLTIGGAFKKFGGLVKGIFVKDKGQEKVEERNLTAAEPKPEPEYKAPQPNGDLDAVGNEEALDNAGDDTVERDQDLVKDDNQFEANS